MNKQTGDRVTLAEMGKENCARCKNPIDEVAAFCVFCGFPNERFNEVRYEATFGKTLAERKSGECDLGHPTTAEMVTDNFPFQPYCADCGRYVFNPDLPETNDPNDLRQQIEQAEELREQGNSDEAMVLLTEVVQQAQERGHLNLVASALGHRILCHKHLFQNTGNEVHLVNMEQDVAHGLALPIAEMDKAVFYLRQGDTFLFRNYAQQAENAYDTACTLVAKGGHAEAEYLGHLAEAKSLNGKCNEAIELLLQAIGIANIAQNVRPFHKLIILSGLQARLIKTALACKKYGLAIGAFVNGYSIAWWLRLWYHMPQRLNQYHTAIFRK